MRIGFFAILLASILAVVGLSLLLWTGNTAPAGKTLTVYYGAGMQKPVAEIVAAYRGQYDVEIQTVAAGSGELQGRIVTTQRGDLFLAADAIYLEELRQFKRGGKVQAFVDEILPVAWQKPVIAVAKGNPKGIRGLEDLLRADVRLSLADPEVAAISYVARKRIDRDRWDRLWKKKHVGRPKVTLVTGDLEIGAADAGIVWDSAAVQYKELDLIAVPEFDVKRNQIAIGVLRSTTDATRALHFARYLTARDRGLKNFSEHGYLIVDGDVWAEKPELTLYSGGLNWVAIEKIVQAFQTREGCGVLTRYGGCGQLVGEMKIKMKGHDDGPPSDLYFACDVKYMDDVQQWFKNPTNVTKAPMVLGVAEGNPLGIHALKDLARDGLRVGICDAELSALGYLTKRLLDSQGIYEKVSANVKDRPSTAAVLVERVALGNLDAAIVYLPNQVKEGRNVDVVPIDDPLAQAIQPIAVGAGSDHGQLAGRLMERILSAEARGVFEKYKFEWLSGGDGK